MDASEVFTRWEERLVEQLHELHETAPSLLPRLEDPALTTSDLAIPRTGTKPRIVTAE